MNSYSVSTTAGTFVVEAKNAHDAKVAVIREQSIVPGDLKVLAVNDERSEYVAERFEFYRSRGEDWGTAGKYADEDAKAKFS